MMNFDVKIENILILAISQSLDLFRLIVIVTSVLESFLMTRKIKHTQLNSARIQNILLVHFNHIGSNHKKKSVWIKFVVTSTILSVVRSIITIIQEGLRMKLLLLLIVLPIAILSLATHFRIVFNVITVNEHLDDLSLVLGTVYTPAPTRIIDNIYLHLEKSKNQHDPWNQLIQARQIYNLIHENVALINQSCGITILLSFLFTVAFLISKGYEILVMIVGDWHIKNITGEDD
jgi:hypothetical protein